MSEAIKLDEIQFGERDALHEFMKQDRQNIQILDNSFVIPPRVRMSELESGARFLILGPKGSGKTTLLWHLKRQYPIAKSKLILFKSDLRKEDRDKLDRMTDLIVVSDQKNIRFETDYKTVWEWYLLKNIVSLIDNDDVSDGLALYKDIRNLLDIKTNRVNTIFDNFYVETIKGKIKLSLGHGDLKSELAGEVEAKRQESNIDLLELIRMIQATIGKVRLWRRVSIRLYIDELEFFMSRDGDGERDRRLVRDLVFAVNSINQLFASSETNAVVIASLRSEILNSINTTNEEIDKVVDAFGVKLNWYHNDPSTHPVLKIFENKIKCSEVLARGECSEDVWSKYFPTHIDEEPIKKYLLDMGLHRPRGVVLKLQAALETNDQEYYFTENSFKTSKDIFGRYMLQEFIDEISASYDEQGRENILMMFRGYSYAFSVSELIQRVFNLASKNRKLAGALRKLDVEHVVKFLFRIGMIGNQFDLEVDNRQSVTREIWSFRGETDPIIESRFVIHRSIRKVLQTV